MQKQRGTRECTSEIPSKCHYSDDSLTVQAVKIIQPAQQELADSSLELHDGRQMSQISGDKLQEQGVAICQYPKDHTTLLSEQTDMSLPVVEHSQTSTLQFQRLDERRSSHEPSKPLVDKPNQAKSMSKSSFG